MSRLENISEAVTILEDQYPLVLLGNKQNPLDEYLYILLSLRTHEKGFEEAYRRFKKAFPSWKGASEADIREIAEAIAVGGLGLQKARRIRDALRIIEGEFGEVSLRRLRRRSREDAEAFLMRLPGVGLKSARCVMMYSLGFAVLPVDTHVARITYRLGWVPKVEPRRLHDLLEEMVPEERRYAFHVHCVQHGRAICRGQYPQCRSCCLTHICPQVGVQRSYGHHSDGSGGQQAGHRKIQRSKRSK